MGLAMVLLNTMSTLRIREASWALVFNYAVTISQYVCSRARFLKKLTELHACYVSRYRNSVSKITPSIRGDLDDLDECECDLTAVEENLASWMASLPAKLTSLPIFNLTLPGSHDSGSYGLETKSGIAPDKPDLRSVDGKIVGHNNKVNASKTPNLSE